jgi:transposase
MDTSYKLYVGVDWATDAHQVCVIDADRRILAEKTVEHSGVGIAEFIHWLAAFPQGEPASTAVAIEIPRGAVVETLLERGFHVFSVNPKQLDRFRDRHTVAGAKDDRRDAFVLADSLRTDEPCFHRLRIDDPVTIQLRELTRVDEDLRVEENRLCNRLREQLHRFFPQMLRLSPAANEPFLWDLVELIPVPAAAARVKSRQVDKVLRARKIRRWKAEQVLAELTTTPLQVAPGAVEAARAHIEILLPLVHLVHAKRQDCTTRIDRLLDALPVPPADEGQKCEHRDVDILLSMPGAGKVVAASVLAEASQPLAERDYHALRTQTGVAPVTRASGKRSKERAIVVMRRGCNGRLRWAMFHWARVAVQRDEQLRAWYASMRRKGHSNGRALRAIADRLLRVLLAMLRDGTLFDPARQRAPGTVPAPAQG